MPILKYERNREFPTYSPPQATGAEFVDNRAGPNGLNHGPLSLFDKVRNYKVAAAIRASGLYPYFRPISSAQDTEVIVKGRKVLMLGSNSYLGLTNHPKIKEAARAAIEKYGTDRKSTRLNSSHLGISYAVFCL